MWLILEFVFSVLVGEVVAGIGRGLLSLFRPRGSPPPGILASVATGLLAVGVLIGALVWAFA